MVSRVRAMFAEKGALRDYAPLLAAIFLLGVFGSAASLVSGTGRAEPHAVSVALSSTSLVSDAAEVRRMAAVVGGLVSEENYRRGVLRGRFEIVSVVSSEGASELLALLSDVYAADLVSLRAELPSAFDAVRVAAELSEAYAEVSRARSELGELLSSGAPVESISSSAVRLDEADKKLLESSRRAYELQDSSAAVIFSVSVRSPWSQFSLVSASITLLAAASYLILLYARRARPERELRLAPPRPL